MTYFAGTETIEVAGKLLGLKKLYMLQENVHSRNVNVSFTFQPDSSSQTVHVLVLLVDWHCQY